MTGPSPNLPAPAARALDELVAAAKAAFGDDLVSISLFGSAAEGKMRATSDLNVAVVLSRFDGQKAAALREPVRTGKAMADLVVMFLLESEVGAAAEAFANKFSDIQHRHQVLHGKDVFADLAIPRPAAIHRLKQVLLNLAMRLRQAYVLRGLREEQLAIAIADAAGPLRAAAAALVGLEGGTPSSPKEALEKVTPPGLQDLLPAMSQARETRVLPAGAAAPALLRTVELVQALRERAAKLA